MEPDEDSDHGGRSFSAASDNESHPYEGDDWLTDDPDGRGEFAVVSTNKSQDKQAKTPTKTRKSNRRPATAANSTTAAATASATNKTTSFDDTVSANDNKNNMSASNTPTTTSTGNAAAATQKTFPIRIKFPLQQQRIDQTAITAFKLLFKALHRLDRDLLIVDIDGKCLSTQDVPSTISAFTERFSLFVNKPPSHHVTAEAVCSLRTRLSLHDIKNSPSITTLLANKHLHIESNPLAQAKVIRLGFCHGTCPRSTNRDDWRDHTVSLLEKHMSEGNRQELIKRQSTPTISLAFQSKPFFHGSGDDLIKAQAIEISCPLAVADIMRQSLMALCQDGHLDWYTFIPSSLGWEAPAFYRRQLLLHNQKLTNMKRITVYGLFPSVLYSDITYDIYDDDDNPSKTTTIEQMFYYNQYITSIERTNKSDSEGKFFFITSTDWYDKACNEIDEFTKFCQLHRQTGIHGLPPSIATAYPQSSKILPKRKDLSSRNSRDPPTDAPADSADATPPPDPSSSLKYSAWVTTHSDPAPDSTTETLLDYKSPPASYSAAVRRTHKSSSGSVQLPTPPDATHDIPVTTTAPPSPSDTALLAAVQQLITMLDDRFTTFANIISKSLNLPLSEEMQTFRATLQPIASLLATSTTTIDNNYTTPDQPTRPTTLMSDDTDTVDDNNNNDTALTQATSDQPSPLPATTAAVPTIPTTITPTTPVEVTPTKSKRKQKPPTKNSDDLPPDIALRAKLNTQQERQRRQKELKNEARKLHAARARAPPS